MGIIFKNYNFECIRQVAGEVLLRGIDLAVPGSGRSPGEGNGNPLQYSCLENPMDGGAWQATVHRITKNGT